MKTETALAAGAKRSGPCEGKGVKTFTEGVLTNNPIFAQVLGICSALAVTSKLETSLVMGIGYVFVLSLSAFVVSLLRKTIPHRIRIITQVLVVCVFVIVLDQLLKAFYFQASRQLGPYVGLIITNTLTLGRTEGFSIQNKPLISLVDGAGNGLGYAAVLAVIGTVRELLGSGKLLGHVILSPHIYTPNQLMILAPGAFFGLGILIAVLNVTVLKPKEVKK
jgi:Na+-transporting NADH:ubiquinone oxidoreductase subunit D